MAKYNSMCRIKDIKNSNKNRAFDITHDPDAEMTEMLEKVRFEDTRNQNYVEKKLFSNLSLYEYKNKALTDKFTLKKLTAESKLKTKQIILETVKKRRDMKFDNDEKIVKLFDVDIKDVWSELHSKLRKEYEDKHGQSIPEESMLNNRNKLGQPQAKPSQPQQHASTLDDLSDVSSIDSDTKEEEKKYSSLGGVLGKSIDTPLFHIL